jgi:murein DD-endopeptidase MepM/ murein hydrolase activator NlpD
MKPALLFLVAGVLSTAAAQATLTYTVHSGDTLYRIATSRGTTTEALQRLNNLSGTTLEVGQVLKLPAVRAGPAPVRPAVVRQAPAARPSPAAPLPDATGSASARPAAVSTTVPAPASPAPVAGAVAQLDGVSISAPRRLRMGDAFVLRLSGQRAAQATVRFPSEVGEDVRLPNEVLTPIGAAGEYLVLGRVVLGKDTPVVYEVSLNGQSLRGTIPVTALEQPIQHLTLPKSATDGLTSKDRPAEEQLVEAAYARRTAQAWNRPFAAPLASTAVSSSFGQPRTYQTGGKVSYHYGTDYPAAVGTPVRAVNDGTVVIAGRYPVRGGLVAIDHGDGLISLYFHQSKVLATVGQKVKRGEVVGQVGSTGMSAGPHLHLELRVRGEGTLPALWLGKLWP